MLEHLSWHWLFVAGGLPSLLTAALIARCVPESPVRTRAKADWAGAGVLSLALIALLAGLSEGAHWGWASAPVLALGAASVALLALWIRVERRVEDPLIDLRTLARRGMAATNATTFLVGFAMTGFFVAMPALVQSPSSGFGASPVEAGLLLLPFSLAMMIGGPAGGALLGRAGRLAVLRGGLATAALAVTLMAVAHDDEVLLCAWLAMLGSGVAFALAAIGALVIDHSRPSETGVAGGMNSIMRTVGGAFGGQIAAALITASAAGGFTQALAVTAAAAALGLVPTLLLARAPRLAAAPRSLVAAAQDQSRHGALDAHRHQRRALLGKVADDPRPGLRARHPEAVVAAVLRELGEPDEERLGLPGRLVADADPARAVVALPMPLPGGTVIVSPGPRWCATPSRSSRSAPSITSKCSVWRSWTCGCATTPRALPTASNSK